MLAVFEVDAGQEAKRGEATDEEGQQTPPPPPQPQPQPLKVARPPRQPTPDHPPYCWMIGEAIDLLAEDGGSAEDSISACIGARHPGVPPMHDRLLRHYLGKHVAEGIFMRTAAGRYKRCPEENEEQAEAGSCKPASVEAKRGRGRPRRHVSPSTPPAGRKDGGAGAQWMTPPASSSSTPAVAAKDSVPMSLAAVADKDGSQALSLKPKRRCCRRLRKLGMATTMDSSGEALVAGKKHGSEVPYTLDKEHEPPRELGLVIFGDSSAASTMDMACTEVPPTTPPVGGDQPLDLALVTTTEVPMPETAPTPAMDKDGGKASSIVDKDDNICTTPTTPEPGSQACKLALMAAEVPPTKPLVDGGQPLDLALVTTTEVPVPEPAPTPTLTPAMDKDGGQPLDLALVTTTEVPVSEPAPTPAMGKKGGLKEAPSATYKDVLQPRKPGSAPTAGKKAGGKALSVSTLLEARRRQHKSPVATGDRSALTPGKKLGCKLSFASPKLTPVIAGGCPTPASVADQGGMEASAALKQHGQPRKLYPVTADEISDDPGVVLLALPSQTLAASNAQLQNLGTSSISYAEHFQNC